VTNHLNGKHGNDENHSSNAAEEKFGAVHTETSTRKRKLKEQLEIVRRIKKKVKQILINNVTIQKRKTSSAEI